MSIAESERQVATFHQPPRVALVGNPNAGKTSLFNALTGLRAKTANYPGITVDVRQGKFRLDGDEAHVLDLPGLYSLQGHTPEEQVTTSVLTGTFRDEPTPDVIVLVVDATNVERNLFLASEVVELNRPTVVALTLMDQADRAGFGIDVEELASRLKCPVVPVSAKTKQGLAELRSVVSQALNPSSLPVVTPNHESCIAGCTGCSFAARYDWAEGVARASVAAPTVRNQFTERLDSFLTHPVLGIAAFLLVMLGVFYLIFSLAGIPMALIEEVFGWLGRLVDKLIPATAIKGPIWYVGMFSAALSVFWLGYRTAGLRWSKTATAAAVGVSMAVALLPLAEFHSLIVDGVIGGVGGIMVFLPQICILFFFISLLEDSGYLARASFVMERLMRFVGLPGKAFVPMLSAHACAIPGIMAARVIENWRDRLVTILVLPLLTCSARLPVYGMLAILLFSESKLKASLVFLGAYLLGIVAALAAAFFLKHTILRGTATPLVLELPPYRRPSLRNAMITVVDRATIFVRNAGTVILVISITLWALATYPRLPEGQVAAAATSSLTADATGVVSADAVMQSQLAYSFAGRLGRAFEPVFRPLGFDWKINVGVISSFAAREVIVSTLSIMYGIGEQGGEDQATLTETLRRQTHADGTPVFTRATCYSLLVFYVLAMQCLPTQAVTRRETGAWKWAIFQLVYMTTLAYVAALVTYQVVSRLS